MGVLSYLGIQSVFSFLKSTLTIETIIKEIKNRQFETVILADENLHGMLSFFEMAKTSNLHAILTQRISIVHDDLEFDVFIGVMNQTGYLNLILLNQLSQEQNVTLETLKGHQDGLSVTLYRLKNIYDEAHYEELVMLFIKTLKYALIGVSFQTEEDDALYKALHLKMSEKHHIPAILIHLSHHVDDHDVSMSKHLFQIGNHPVKEGQFQLLEKLDLERIYQNYPNLKHHMKMFMKDHQFHLEFPKFNLPQIPLEEGVTSKEYLTSLAFVGLEKRLKNKKMILDDKYKTRLTYELSVIFSLGFEDYFLVVYDIIKYAKTHDIYVGPGRGSVAGSLVAYVLGITEVDPIQYDLLFERFLNPERASMPDIDMDFPDDKRDDVILYAQSRFGNQHIASIVTYQTFGKKSAIRDLSKIFGLSAPRIKVFTEAIMKDDIDALDHEMVMLYQAVKQIEGLPRQTGTHAAGVILSKEPLNHYIPLTKGPYPFYQTQFEAKELESIGLLKMDFLGIRNLKIIDDVKKEIQKKMPHFSLSTIPDDDLKTYSLLSEAKTDGIFQLESHGMRQVLRQLKPSHFEDVVALLALYRPGPMAFIETYVERRHGKQYEHMHPSFIPFLTSTYGIIIYQEQIMQIAQAFAGYSLAEADLLRRGISKKDEALLKSEASRFISKAIQHGQNEKDATDVYDLIVRFSDYGFNRSHSVSYAMVAYQMAYLKANHYIYFMQALLNSVIGSETSVNEYMKDLKKQGITLLPPNIKSSTDVFQIIDEHHMLAPLTIVKSIGHKTVLNILNHRYEHDLTSWMKLKTWLKDHISERQLIQMIHAGCFDDIGHTRRTLIENISLSDVEYMLYLDQVKMKEYDEFDVETLAQLERDALGFQILYDPNTYLQNIQKTYVSEITSTQDIYVRIVSMKNIKTKTNEDMVFLSCHDGKEAFEMTVFPKTLEAYKNTIKIGLFKVRISKQMYKEKASYVAQSFLGVEKKRKNLDKD